MKKKNQMFKKYYNYCNYLKILYKIVIINGNKILTPHITFSIYY